MEDIVSVIPMVVLHRIPVVIPLRIMAIALHAADLEHVNVGQMSVKRFAIVLVIKHIVTLIADQWKRHPLVTSPIMTGRVLFVMQKLLRRTTIIQPVVLPAVTTA